jgi:hypothetical protein
MNGRVCFRDFRVQVAAYAQTVGSPLGVCIGNIPGLAGLVNIATERLISDPLAPEEGWWGGWAKYVFNVSQGNPYIVAPRGVARIIVQNLNTCPLKLQNGFYEFLDYGEGLQPKPCKQNVCDGFAQTYDRDTVPILGSLNPTAQFVRVVPTDSRDVGKAVIIQGTDQNGNTITSTDPVTNQTIPGEILVLASPFIQSVNQFLVAPNSNGINGIQKDTTSGSVTFQQVDALTGAASPLSSMEPSETTAQYRRYYVRGIPCFPQGSASAVNQIVAQCKLDYIPIASDPDYLGIPNVPALLAECEALRYETVDDMKSQQLAATKHAKALGLLAGQLTHYLGDTRPAVSVSLFGPQKHLRYQPI